ncbi:uncharacterized protein DUF3274 [Paraburkholderia eburnea]|uniref:Uncharacterized protein DUF3274 n=1 Tax=Paraburkholderia eburnea TaxID=1189126 RepID=A0A2S4M7G2_9BURK|nr:DUF3274 domain-containing protein [Paraburkholderia eburnea]POR50670.1 uncharacterized protein DUF3274 [Paraburkholderia eburnea]PRZ21438.1 uncharacterized protein DUF3274 [Paraburkholderia eburnea]
MSNATSNNNVIGSGAGVTTSNRASDRPVARPNDLPGILIFSHGVNDPGANYETVEEGICQGLNERLNRPDMCKGEYGARYQEAMAAKKKGQANRAQDQIAADPDKALDDQTRSVEFRSNGSGFGGAFAGISAWREETPNEARARMSQDPAALTKNDPSGVLTGNSYHSAILRDPWNQRFGTAMDMAIGQAKTMDNKDWLALWLAMADWKTDFTTVSSLPKYPRLSAEGRKLVQQACEYYNSGAFPQSVVSSGMPTLVVSQSMDQNANPEKPVTPPFNMDFSGLAR